MNIHQYDQRIADPGPGIGTESGKMRPALIVKTDVLNTRHPSTIICPVICQIYPESEIFRVHVKKGTAGLVKTAT
jgi:mRNA interferase MazF